MRLLRWATVLIVIAAAPLAAQKPKDAPKRPSLPANADTCDARAYFALGMSVLETTPWKAADAFYWATRLEPMWPDAVYARRIALLMTDPVRLSGYMEGNRGTVRSKAIREIDALMQRALTLDPFLKRNLDRTLFKYYLRWSYETYVRQNGGGPAAVDYGLLEHWVESYLASAPPRIRGWSLATSGRYDEALKAYAAALQDRKNTAGVHAERGRIFHMLGQDDSAVAEMGRAVAELRESDEKELVYVYESKAL